jgi:hypothetical protein
MGKVKIVINGEFELSDLWNMKPDEFESLGQEGMRELIREDIFEFADLALELADFILDKGIIEYMEE